MTVVQTVLVFVGIPAAAVGLITLAVYGKTLLRQPNRYRPGKPWPYEAAWFVPHPDAVLSGAQGARGGAQRAIDGATSTTAVGGASGEW